MERRFMELEMGKIAYVAKGQGPALILMHSLGFSADVWSKVIESLAERYSVYALDMLGHGDSDKPPKNYLIEDYGQSVIAFMDQLRLQKTLVCGNSIGAFIAFEMAATYPQRLDKLILVGLAVRDVWQRMERLILAASTCDLEGNPIPFSMPQIATMGFTEETPELLEWINQQWARAGKWTLKGAMACTIYDLVPKLQLVKCPTLVLYGSRDIVRESGKILVQGIKGARYALIENGGHLPQTDNPKAFIQEVNSFLGL